MGTIFRAYLDHNLLPLPRPRDDDWLAYDVPLDTSELVQNRAPLVMDDDDPE